MTENRGKDAAGKNTPPGMLNSVEPGFSRQQDDHELDKSQANVLETYTAVAELYHTYRPRYPESLVDVGIQSCKLLTQKPPMECRILEIGCGPGTLTAALAKRGYQIIAIEPGTGMIEKARQVCRDYSDTVTFHQKTFKEFSPDAPGDLNKGETYDAIVAASSLHWALGGDDDNEALIEKLHSLLNPNGGALLLFWNFPPEPQDNDLDIVADALNLSKPFHFSTASLCQHKERLREKVLAPVENSGFFTTFVDHSCSNIEEDVTITDYINFLKTLGNYIAMEDEERQVFFATVAKTLRRDRSTDNIKTSRESLLNVSYPVPHEK